MRAVLLAAGFATRMYPLTRDRAKPLLEVGGRTVIDWLMERVAALPFVDELVVVVNGRFRDDFEAWARKRVLSIPLRIVDDGAQDEPEKLGALGDLRLAWHSLPDDGDPLLVAAADNLVHFDLLPFAEAFGRHPESPLLLVREIQGEIPPRRYNEVVLGEGGRVLSFREKPADPHSPLAAICLYFLPGDVRGDLEAYLSADTNHDAPGYFIEWLVKRRAVWAAQLDGAAWFDIGNLETLERARVEFSPKI